MTLSVVNKPVSVKVGRALWWVALVLLIGYRLWLFFSFHAQYTDLDQALVWEAAVDMSQGNYYEPKFYGQTYVVLIEAFFTAPLLWLGMPVNYAAPLVTLFMALFPFLLISVLEKRNGRCLSAVVVLLLAMCMPVQYDLLTGLSRGFVGGVFVAVWCVLPLYGAQRWRFLVAGIATGLGAVITPNSVVFSVPVLAVVSFNNLRNLRWLLVLAGLLPGVVWELYSQWFYTANTNHIVWDELDTSWSLARWVHSFAELDFWCLFAY